MIAGCGGGSSPYSAGLAGGAGATPSPTPSTMPTPTPSPTPPGGATPLAILSSKRDGNQEIYRVLSDGSLTRLTSTPEDEFLLDVSADGTMMSFFIAGDIYTSKTDGTGRVRQTTSGKASGGGLSSDGKRLTFVETTDRTGNVLLIGTGPVKQVKVKNTDGTGTAAAVLREAVGLGDPRFSPDSSRIGFTEFVGGGDYRLWTMAADGSDAKIATSHPERTFSGGVPEHYFTLNWDWLPDGRLLYNFIDLGSGAAKYPLESIRPDATGLQLIRNAPDRVAGRVSSDGAQLLISDAGIALEGLVSGARRKILAERGPRRPQVEARR